MELKGLDRKDGARNLPFFKLENNRPQKIWMQFLDVCERRHITMEDQGEHSPRLKIKLQFLLGRRVKWRVILSHLKTICSSECNFVRPDVSGLFPLTTFIRGTESPRVALDCHQVLIRNSAIFYTGWSKIADRGQDGENADAIRGRGANLQRNIETMSGFCTWLRVRGVGVSELSYTKYRKYNRGWFEIFVPSRRVQGPSKM